MVERNAFPRKCRIVIVLSLAVAMLAAICLVMFIHSGWDAIHPWVSMMALFGSVSMMIMIINQIVRKNL